MNLPADLFEPLVSGFYTALWSSFCFVSVIRTSCPVWTKSWFCLQILPHPLGSNVELFLGFSFLQYLKLTAWVDGRWNYGMYVYAYPSMIQRPLGLAGYFHMKFWCISLSIQTTVQVNTVRAALTDVTWSSCTNFRQRQTLKRVSVRSLDSLYYNNTHEHSCCTETVPWGHMTMCFRSQPEISGTMYRNKEHRVWV